MNKIKMLLYPLCGLHAEGVFDYVEVVGVKEIALLTVRKAVDELGETL